MCGIAGVLAPAGTMDVGDALRAMAAAIVHRGPDDEGFLQVSAGAGQYQVGLAHRRLSIIDLATGHQPLGNEDGSVQIVFNGEIYNFEELRAELLARGHLFHTHSDTETIVHAYEEWGTACVTRLRGMFAFALWDAKAERLLLARDRFGKKPLFLAKVGGALVFGSEIKALQAVPGFQARVELRSLRRYFEYRYVPGPATLLEGVRKLPPGCIAVWEKSALREERYYHPPDRAPAVDLVPDQDAVTGFLNTLDEAVRIRMVADVPFGAFLSGGIDSSAIVTLMSRHASAPVKTFSVGFTESAFSELAYARTIAKHFGTDHHELEVSESHLMDHLPALVRFRDAPVAEPSDIPIYLLSVEARRSVKMVLTGEGSDEILAGYPKHSAERFAALYQSIPAFLRHRMIGPAVRALPFRFHRAKTALSALDVEDRQARMARWFGALAPDEVDALLLPEVARLPPVEVMDPFDVVPGNGPLRSILYFDQTSWLPDNLLERGDRMTMAASIEARMPFMDHVLAEYVSRLPDRWRIRGRTTKYVLRQAMARLLPRSILERPKIGFRVPVSEWFRGPMRDYLADHLLGSDSRLRAYCREATIQRVLEEHSRGEQNHEKLLWTLLSLEIWHRECL